MTFMTELFSQFHFLRPLWLPVLLPAWLLIVLIARRRHAKRSWRRLIAPHLLDHLLISAGQTRRNKLQPLYLLALLWTLTIVALAGPAWQRVPAPFAEDQAALVLIVKVTPGMLARDIQPSRLERAVHKIHDLLALRPGARSALIAYAGSAHLVMPLTRDADIIETFAAELDPQIMPMGGGDGDGDVLADAVALAGEQFAGSESGSAGAAAGSIVVFADSVAETQLAGLRQLYEAGGAAVNILALAGGAEVVPAPDSPPAPALNRAEMEAAARAGGGTLVLATVDDSDVRRLDRHIESRLSAAAAENEHWRDAGYFLLPLLLVLILFWFRPGWVIAREI
jgi:Ca-activated chloride channel family protein